MDKLFFFSRTIVVIGVNQKLGLAKAGRCVLYVFCAVVFFLPFACSPSATTNQSTDTSSVINEHSKNSAPIVPAADRLLHYWDGYNFRDKANIADPEKAEQSLVNFIGLFPGADLTVVSASIKSMLAAAKQEPEVYDYFIGQYERYLYDPNSPMRNDQYYEPVLAFKLDSTRLQPEEKIKIETLLALLRKNMPGSKAADFSYRLPNGASGRLSTLASPLTVLFFYEPGCSHCEEAIALLRGNAQINAMIQDKRLTFLAVYPFGGREIWEGYRSEIPDNWMNGFDEQMEVVKKGKYDLKATPTIMLLDERKHVVLKDVDVRVLIDYLR